MEKYKAISKAITNKVSGLRYPNSFQLAFRVNFPKYVDYWWMKDEESILFQLGYKPCMNELETWRCEYSTGENQCEEPWKITKEDPMTGEGNLYWDGLREFTLIGLKIQRLLNKHKWSMKYSNSEYDRETYKGWKEKLESMKIDEKILEDGINEMTYRMKGRDPSVRLKDWRIRITQNPFKGMSKEFARDMPQQLLEYC